MSSLFTPFTLKDVTLRNRIVVSPMCQYSAENGTINDWHYVHLAGLARGGAGLIVAEATAVSPEGRITPGCAGIWSDEQIEPWKKAVGLMKAAGAVPGIQIAHAGRKASANRPWEGDDHIPESDPRGWETIAPSAVAFGANLGKVPQAMEIADIERVKADFVAAAKRALAAGFEWLELHFAHGYLGQSFFSTWSNKRTDNYGGDFDGRARFLLETLAAVREVWPEHLPLAARFGVTEFDGSDDLEEGIEMVRRFKDGGLDIIDVSIGFSTPTANIPWGPAFMAPIAQRVRREVGLPATTSWLISEAKQANSLIEDDVIDLVSLGRPLLANNHWPYQAALELGIEKPSWTLPAPYAHWLERYRTA
ncbi:MULTISPECIES: NADH:flavin oxidoreductase/NADH oxidase [unclassified Rhizobium]|uniref:NADH:flavin oxidoreductase/NADH oxidase n=1 Tax=unclassified Rhizobium TaxID=2613769 RepID=UPI001781EC39|nr:MULTISPECIES: NADH:flavin oxidoreductase/NADH oxidase [unclassified Rhizobium]MBD8688331.1 NADH:flavin oxidoreductase/NADH oxidase [Rhizobium sp. CFBP 13644]MBD8692786.1 NADH:flavin oxidoreductase/NADH oxidase [Rhizobium sp. CFBP 13717]